MKLVAFGDSFVEGLIKEPKVNTPEERNEINFVTQLQKLENQFTSVENYGSRGYGTEAIAYSVYKRLQTCTKNCFFLVVWSSPFRSSTYNETDDTYVVSTPKTFKNYSFHLDMHIEAISSILKKRGIPYAFINSFSPHTHQSKLFTAEYFENLNYINATYKRNTLFDIIAEQYGNYNNTYNGMLEHVQFDIDPSKFIAKCKHPTPEGHCLIAQTINNSIKKIIDNHV